MTETQRVGLILLIAGIVIIAAFIAEKCEICKSNELRKGATQLKLSKYDFDTLEKMPPAVAFRYYQALRTIDAWKRERPAPPPMKLVITRKIARNIARREMKKDGMRHIDRFLQYYWKEYYINALTGRKPKKRRFKYD